MFSLALPQTFVTLTIIVSFILAITIHEYSHALVAYWLGDDTAYRAGRLTLNPFAHLDLFGLLFLILFRFGWAKPVPMEPRNFKFPKLFAVCAAFAGPASNLLLALTLLIIAHVTFMPVTNLDLFAQTSTTLTLGAIFHFAAYINVMLGIFNLLPIPPLDGGHLVYALIPPAWHRGYHHYLRYSIFILILFLMLPTTQTLLLNAIRGTYQALTTIAQSFGR